MSDEQLTRERVLAMPAGRKLDSMVAERVMGWRLCGSEGQRSKGLGQPPEWSMNSSKAMGCPKYSTDIAAAMEVMQKLERRYVSEELVQGDTLPLAICRFALIVTLPAGNN